RDQQLDTGAAAVDVFEVVDLAHGLGIEPRPAVLEIVAGHTRDRRVAQTHLTHRGAHTATLVRVEFGRLAGVDPTELAAADALLSGDEERGLPILPAFEDVRTARLFAHGVQVLLAHQ